ncbi:DNA-binding transcriptional regulator, AcrR family [Nocardioides exalbidus]|uniref:DNA-binding transcriptional regulator, AcrR family n=1 Tax=Nocardioides exalbidus TaxID=402596 RepID=A0A1H4K1U3_9ACTN|nr:TetR/AcrR family transcriptional regulator [Nocardioides exalbidus]SEB51872.1 DNA-binding transcriptional regulator, AcrR family [Nocardioides exalbidus]
MSATPYHHGNLRDALVEAGVDVVRDGGPEALSLRELARRVGVSHAATYRHFADREALVDAVAERALASLVAEVHHRLDTVDDPDEVTRARRRLVEIGVGYVAFAMTESGLFRLLFTAYPDAPGGKDDKGDPAGDDPYGMLNQALDDLVEVGYLDARERAGADVTCWSAVHGFSVLNVEGPLRGLSPADRDAALSTLLLGIDRAFGAGGSWPELAPVGLARG